MAAKKKAPAKNKSVARSSNATSGVAKFPRHSIGRAIRIPKAIIEQNAGNECTVAQSADFVGVGNHGPYKLEVSSATKYGLLESPSAGRIAITELARRILRPQSESDELAGIREAVLNAPQISDVYKHYRGENLPDEKFLNNTICDTYKVPRDKVEEFTKIFIETLTDAKLLQTHGGKTRVLDVTEEDPDSTEKTETLKKLGKGVKIEASDTCFVMQPFGPPLGTYYEKIYKPAIEKAGLKPMRADADIFGTGKIIDQVWRGILEAKVLVAELTNRNPNVFYELGLAHALNKPVVLVSSNEHDVPFDLQHIRVIYYDTTDPFWGNKLMDKVAENIISAIRNPEEAVFKNALE